MAIDAFEMAVVHRVFRNELDSAPRLIRSVRPGQKRRSTFVADHVANVLAALHHHHTAEDALLWPKLHSRVPMHEARIRQMKVEHEGIATLIHRVESALEAWAPSSQPALAEQLIVELRELALLVGNHLNDEERLVVPLINAYITDDEWHEATDRGASFVSLKNMAFGIVFIGLALQATTSPDERRRFLAGMPAPQRLLIKLLGRRAVVAYQSKLDASRPG